MDNNTEQNAGGDPPPPPEVSLRPRGGLPLGTTNTAAIPDADDDQVSEGGGEHNEQIPPGGGDAEAEARQTTGPVLGGITLRTNPEFIDLEEAELHPAAEGILMALMAV